MEGFYILKNETGDDNFYLINPPHKIEVEIYHRDAYEERKRKDERSKDD